MSYDNTKLGPNNVSAIYLGTSLVTKIYVGDTQIYPSDSPPLSIDINLTDTLTNANNADLDLTDNI